MQTGVPDERQLVPGPTHMDWHAGLFRSVGKSTYFK